MEALPTVQQLVDAASVGDKPDEAGRLILILLSYATDNEDTSALDEKTHEACEVLLKAWEECPNLEDALVDALWMRSCTLGKIIVGEEKEEDDKQQRRSTASQNAFAKVLETIVKVPGRNSFYVKLQTNLLPSFLEPVGLVSEEDLLKRLRIHNTQVNYKQQKYNLLQEESEGYSKLLQFLSASSPGDSTQDILRLHQLMGTFELDPNRVLDLLVDSLEVTLYPHSIQGDIQKKEPQKSDAVVRLLSLMRDLPVQKMPSLISFKLASPGATSQTLMHTLAFLSSEGILDFKTLFESYSGSIENEIDSAHKIFWMKEKKRIQGLTRVSLSGNKAEDPKLIELRERLQKALIPLSTKPVIHILLLLLEWKKWPIVEELLSVKAWEQLCCLLPEKFASAICNIAEEKLCPWHIKLVGTPSVAQPFKTAETELTQDDISINDVVESVSKYLLITAQSGYIQNNPTLYCQLCRVLGKVLCNNDTEGRPSNATYSFFRRFMVPSLSLFGANPAISSELWIVLKNFPYTTRYRLYEDWRGTGLEKMGIAASPLSGKPLPVVESEINAGKAARYALKRLSKDNIRDMSRLLAKATHSSPLVVYGTILSQIESYDNMVDVMVDAQRFSNALSLDVLGYCILGRLSGTTGGVNRDRFKEDGVNVSQWLQSLEAFAGSFFKRYPSVEFRGILSYLMHRLQDGQVMELGVLKSLLTVAGGYSFADYSPAASLSESQLEGRAGSFTLKRETMSFGIVEDMSVDATEAIKKVLQSDGFGVSMLVLIAQARSRVIFDSSSGPSKPVKLVGNLYDSCQTLIAILLEFLTTEETDDGSGTAIEEYAKQLPPLNDLHYKFGLGVESSWMLTRPLARSVIQPKESDEAVDPTLVVTEVFTFRKKFENMLPVEVWDHLSPVLFEAFFTNSLYDVLWPSEVYDSEIGRIEKEIERLERTKSGPSSTGQSGLSKNESVELERLVKVKKSLAEDKIKQKEHVESVKNELNAKKESLMNSGEVSRETAKALLLHCVYPRSLQSPDEAMYCSHFILRLHRMETPGFSTMHYIDELISVAAGSLYGLTEGEAAHLAILLWQTWSLVNRWRYDDHAYESEVAGNICAHMVQEDLNSDDTLGSGQTHEVSRNDFIRLYNKWHSVLGSSLIACLESAEYMHSRSGLVVLTRLVDVFPTRPTMGNRLLSTLQPLQDESSNRPDIRAAANAYAMMLLKARDDGKWKEEDASVAQARADKEEAAAKERKRKIEETFDELQRDSEKITEEIGFGGDRRDVRGFRVRGPLQGERGATMERDSREVRDRRSPTRERDFRNERVPDRGIAPRGGERRIPERSHRDAGEGHRMRGEQVSTLEGERGGRVAKRGRGPSPEVGNDDRGNAKRARLVEPKVFEPPRRDSRAPSPQSRRVRGVAEPSRSSRPRRSRR